MALFNQHYGGPLLLTGAMDCTAVGRETCADPLHDSVNGFHLPSEWNSVGYSVLEQAERTQLYIQKQQFLLFLEMSITIHMETNGIFLLSFAPFDDK